MIIVSEVVVCLFESLGASPPTSLFYVLSCVSESRVKQVKCFSRVFGKEIIRLRLVSRPSSHAKQIIFSNFLKNFSLPPARARLWHIFGIRSHIYFISSCYTLLSQKCLCNFLFYTLYTFVWAWNIPPFFQLCHPEAAALYSILSSDK